ncbi:MAG: methionyl-tRNA formyltransferase [Oscillospiraceae bacterium]|nr:methionyl-tRNA formyltransferase [Oscillospiraceae bacterium]
MRIVYMGTPEIARVCLQRIVEDGHEIAAVYTKIDTPKNRGMKLTASPVKEYALEQGIPVIQPTTFKDEAVVEELRALAPELIVVVAYGKILPQSVLDIPEKGCINIHASLLPKLRGAGPIQWSILNGDRETGVTAMYLNAGMDEGDMIDTLTTPIEDTDTTETLTEKLSVLGAELLSKTVKSIAEGTATRTPQNSAEATYAAMLRKDMSPIDWTKSPREISCQVRGLIPWPVATMELSGKLCKVYGVTILDKTTDRVPGTPVAVTKKGLEMACGEGQVILVTEVQAQGGKRMRCADYLRGHPIEID